MAVKKVKQRVEIATPIGRINWPFLLKPDVGRQYSDDKYKADIFWLASDFKESGADLKAAVLKVGREFFKDNSLKLSDFKNPFKKGDDKENPGPLEGCIYVTAKSNNKPKVLGPKKDEWNDEQIASIKSGDYVRFILSVFPYSQSGGGVSVGLNVVQFAYAGESIGGGTAASIALLDSINVELDDVTAEDAGDLGDDEEDL
jgi:hypothetical protein